MRYPAADFKFSLVSEQDLAMLRDWLLRPHVAEWWGTADSIEVLREDYVQGIGAPNATRAYIALLASRPIGFIQSYVVRGSGGGWWEDEEDPGARGIDQFLANTEQLGQGIGSSMIRAFLDHLFSDSTVTVVQTDPDPKNERAIRCCTRAGFCRVREVVTPDGPALLMRCERPAVTHGEPWNAA
jgi:RimJ/RimL family protein N-acetyltransferase